MPSEAPSKSASASVIPSPERAFRDLLELGKKSLKPIERAQIRFVRRAFAPGPFRQAIVAYQKLVGANGVTLATKNLRELHGLDRIPTLGRGESIILVSNHRSFFDMYTLTAPILKRPDMNVRLLFPVRSKFFYDSPAGLLVNGLMSAFAMYPPIFRERSRASLNVASLDETIRLVKAGGVFLGMHPEGKRNTGDDPYQFLPAQRGVGRIVHECPNAKVIPVFINGLGNSFTRQLKSNFDGTGDRVIAVFGEPIDFRQACARPSSPTLHKEIAETTMEHVKRLSQEERVYRSLPRPE